MQLWSTVLAVVACVAFTVALEIPLSIRSRGVRRPIGSGGLLLAAAKTTTRDLSEQEGNFVVNVSIGTPPQNFRLLVSYGDSVTYVRGKDCDTGVCPDHANFDGSKSSTYVGFPKDQQCCVLGGFAFPAKDDIVIGDVKIRQATFVVAVNSSVNAKDRGKIHYDGVLGLGLFKPYFSEAVPILTTALQQKAITASTYTVWLQRQNGGDCEESKAFLPVVGSLTLGAHNKDKCGDAASINWHPLRAPYGGAITDYATKVDQISLGDHVYTLDKKTTWTAQFMPQYGDVLFAPSIIADDIAKRVGAKVQIDSYNFHFYPIDCKAKTPDDVKIVMDGTEYMIHGKHLIDRFYYPISCSLNIVVVDPSADAKYYNFRIGTPFLREYCQTYDAGKNRIGFSKNTDTNEMDTQQKCSGATTLTGLSAMVLATLFAVIAL